MRTRLLNNIPRVAPSETAAPVVLRRHKMERARRGVSFQKTDNRGGGGDGGSTASMLGTETPKICIDNNLIIMISPQLVNYLAWTLWNGGKLPITVSRPVP